jgi:hypothetical protein
MMTASRSFAPKLPVDAEDDVAAAPPPVFPLLPYACTAYVEYCSRDFAEHMDKLSHTDERVKPEDALGLTMLTDMNQAFFAMVWAPLGKAMSQAGTTSTPA